MALLLRQALLAAEPLATMAAAARCSTSNSGAPLLAATSAAAAAIAGPSGRGLATAAPAAWPSSGAVTTTTPAAAAADPLAGAPGQPRSLPRGLLRSRKPAVKRPARHQWHYCAPDYDPMLPHPRAPLPPYAPPRAHLTDYGAALRAALPAHRRGRFRRGWAKQQRLADEGWKNAFWRQRAAHERSEAKLQRRAEAIARREAWQRWQEARGGSSVGGSSGSSSGSGGGGVALQQRAGEEQLEQLEQPEQPEQQQQQTEAAGDGAQAAAGGQQPRQEQSGGGSGGGKNKKQKRKKQQAQ